MFQRSEIYAPRSTEFHELLRRDGWTFKLYSILYGSNPLDRALYDEAIKLAFAQLPRPAVTTRRPGVGFIIMHQGRGWHYLVVSYWDNENELPQIIYVRPIDELSKISWRHAGGAESICVWDLEVIRFERDAYVRHVLSPSAGPHLEAYLACHAASA